jgi:hypothetical protein
MKGIALLSFFYCSLSVFSQQWLPALSDSSTQKHAISFTGTAENASTSLPFSITQKLLFGGEITESLKQAGLEHLKTNNRLGIVLNTEVEYRDFSINLLKRNNWGLSVKAGQFTFMGLSYPKDLYSFVFYGNTSYEKVPSGSTNTVVTSNNVHSLSEIKLTAESFQKIGVGFLNKRTNSTVHFNMYNLYGFAACDFNRLTLYQSQQADTLTFNYNGSFSYTDNRNFTKGVGVGLDADLRFTISGKRKPMHFQFVCQNIGFAKTQHIVTEYSGDTTFTFTGLTYKQLVNESPFSVQSVLDTLGLRKKISSEIVCFPGLVQFSKLVDANTPQKVQAFYGAGMYLTSISIPYLFAGTDFKVTCSTNFKWHLGINANFGGFSIFKGGIYTTMQLKNWYFGLSGTNLIGRTGQSILARIQCVF